MLTFYCDVFSEVNIHEYLFNCFYNLYVFFSQNVYFKRETDKRKGSLFSLYMVNTHVYLSFHPFFSSINFTCLQER